MAIRGVRLKRTVEAFVDAFPRASKLEQLLEYRLEKNLEALVAPGSITDRVFELFMVANSEGWDRDLVAAAWASNPGHRGLYAIVQELALAPSLAPQLEAIVNAENQIHDADRWYRRFGQALARVCRIDVDDTASGTGFLVGPDLVLTNQHVIEPPHQSLMARFDHRGPPYRTEAVAVRVVELVDQSPHSRCDVDPSVTTEPTFDELDYALLRLERTVGDEPIGTNPEPGAPARGWFATVPPPPAAYAPGAPLLILQHPRGEPIKLAFDTSGVIATNPSRTRVRYRTNTEGGSSGSPCFDQHWNLIALHQARDPSSPPAQFNQGVPIVAITARLLQVKSIALRAPES